MGLARIVQVGVEVEELAPGQVDVVDVLVHLLTHIDEVLSRHRVVDHGDAARLFVALRREEGALLAQVVDLFTRIGQHVAKSSFGIIERIHGGSQLIGGAAPLCHVFSSKKPFFTLIQIDALGIVAGKGLLTQPVSFLIALGLLS